MEEIKVNIFEEDEEMERSKLTTEHHILKNWLKDNFVSGKFYTIEEIVANVRYADGTPIFKLNTNPYTHDKCVKLGKMVKELNWATNVERYIPIIKDKKGSIKLCETEQELKDFVAAEKKKVEKVCEYANHLQSLIQVDGTVPIINLAGRTLELKEMKPVDVYKKPNETPKVEEKEEEPQQLDLWGNPLI